MTRSLKRNSFAAGYKVRRILKDIEEGRKLGIQLHTLTLNEFYSALKHARKQKTEFEKHFPGKDFVYDAMDDQQFPYDTDGLDDLAASVRVRPIKATEKRHNSKRKSSRNRLQS